MGVMSPFCWINGLKRLKTLEKNSTSIWEEFFQKNKFKKDFFVTNANIKILLKIDIGTGTFASG